MNYEYNALLQMYGEKSEEVEELRLDLQDVKEMYKLQVSCHRINMHYCRYTYILTSSHFPPFCVDRRPNKKVKLTG